VLEDDMLVSAAAERGRWIASLPHESPDLFNGSAGRLRFHLLLWDETSDDEALAHAVAAGEHLLEAAEQDGDEARWRFPPGYDRLSGAAMLGYAHGAAGIADALLDLFDATADERFLSAARSAGRYLRRLAVRVLDDGSGLDWPSTEGDQVFGPYWCHGATGVGRFLLHAAELDALGDAGELAACAARTTALASQRAGPTQCHGLAGKIEFLLDMFQTTKDPAYLGEARRLARLLEAHATERDGLLMWPSDSPTTFTPDYTVGYAGVAVCLLRLADPERVPHQLSRRGFAFRAARSTGGSEYARPGPVR